MKRIVKVLPFIAAFFALSPQASASVVVVGINTSFGSGNIELLGNSGGLSDIGNFIFETSGTLGSHLFTNDQIASASFVIAGAELIQFEIEAYKCSPTAGTMTDSCASEDHAPGDSWTQLQLVLDLDYAVLTGGDVSCMSIPDPSKCGATLGRFAGRDGDADPVYSVSAVPVPAPAGLLITAMAGLAGLGAFGRRAARRQPA